MSYFSAALDAAMREKAYDSQSELSRKTGVHQGQISKYLADDARPDVDGIAKLCEGLQDAGPAVLVAWLRDMVPESLKNSIRVELASARAQEREPSVFDRLTRPTRELLEACGLQCERNPRFAAALQSTLDLTAA